jgi:HrpA-like RNA helicase
MISKMIIASSQLGCSEEIITIAAALSVQVNTSALVTTNFVLKEVFSFHADDGNVK